MLRTLILFVCLVIISGTCASIDDDHYIAAVVEFTPETNYNPNITKTQAQSVMLNNVKQYDVLVGQAKQKGAQIIVFPEYGLNGAGFETREAIYPFLEAIPDPSQAVICNNATYSDSLPVISTLSCMAISHKIVIVVNMGDEVACTVGVNGCPSDGRFQYNTDIVFSETGAILAKYHKSHLYFEPQFNQPASPDPVTFTTSFGVTFGVMICFDIMFPYPQLNYAEANITNVIYSTWWVNTPPNFSADQVQLSWSRVSNANLLASGIGLNMYSSGSGIYSSGTPMKFFYNPTWTPTQSLLVATLPKNPPASSSANQNIMKEEMLNTQEDVAQKTLEKQNIEEGEQSIIERKVMNSQVQAEALSMFVASPGSKGEVQVSVGNLTCWASYIIANETQEEAYALTVLNGNYNNLFNAQICALVQCANGSCNSTNIEANTVFQEFYLGGNFSSSARLYASVTTNLMYLAPVSLYNTSGLYINSPVFFIPLLSATIFGVLWDNQ